MIRIIRAVQTCMACPSQWDLWDADGNYYYARYRHGCGELRQYQDENWHDAPGNTYIRTIADFEHGHPLDGMIELDEFCRLAGVELDLTMYTNYGEHLRDELVTDGLAFLLEDHGSDESSPEDSGD